MTNAAPRGWHIRRAEPADAPWITELYHDVWHETHGSIMPAEVGALRPMSFFADRVATTIADCLAGVDSHQQGWGFSSWQGHVLGQLWVKPEARGSGMASALLQGALRAMAQEGHSVAVLHCFAQNARGLHFYQREGWKRVELADVLATQGSSILVPFWTLEKSLGS